MLYNVHFIHKISAAPDEVEGPFEIADSAFSDKNKLAARLRSLGVLLRGQRLDSMREENGQVFAFPSASSIWHSLIIVTLEDSPIRIYRQLTEHAKRGYNGYAAQRLVNIDEAMTKGEPFAEAIYPESYKRHRTIRRTLLRRR